MASVTVRSGLRAGAAGIADQVLLSVANLAVGLALARALEPSAFGAYVVAFAIQLMASSVQVSLVTDPLMILGSPMPGAHQSRYLAALLRLQVGLSLSLGALIGVVALALHLAWRDTSHLPAALAGTAVAVVSLQAQSFFRAVFFARLRPARALACDLVLVALTILGLSVLIMQDLLSPFAALAVMGAAALTAAAAAASLCTDLLGAAESLRATWTVHWRYGRWVLATSAAYWGSGQAPAVVAAGVVGPVAAAVIKACQYLVAPINVVFNGLDGILAPRAARIRAGQGDAALARFLTLFALAAGTTVALYALFLLPTSSLLMELLYKGRYSGYTVVVGLLLLDALLSALGRAPVLKLKVLQDTKRIFHAYAWAACAGLAGLLALSPAYGIAGAAAAAPISSAALLAYLMVAARASRVSEAMPRPVAAVVAEP